MYTVLKRIATALSRKDWFLYYQSLLSLQFHNTPEGSGNNVGLLECTWWFTWNNIKDISKYVTCLRSSKRGTYQERNGTSANVVCVAVVKGPAFTLDGEHVAKTGTHDGEVLAEADSSPCASRCNRGNGSSAPPPQRSSRAHWHQRGNDRQIHRHLLGVAA
jgi:hypothetical protein